MEQPPPTLNNNNLFDCNTLMQIDPFILYNYLNFQQQQQVPPAEDTNSSTINNEQQEQQFKEFQEFCSKIGNVSDLNLPDQSIINTTNLMDEGPQLVQQGKDKNQKQPEQKLIKKSIKKQQQKKKKQENGELIQQQQQQLQNFQSEEQLNYLNLSQQISDMYSNNLLQSLLMMNNTGNLNIMGNNNINSFDQQFQQCDIIQQQQNILQQQQQQNQQQNQQQPQYQINKKGPKGNQILKKKIDTKNLPTNVKAFLHVQHQKIFDNENQIFNRAFQSLQLYYNSQNNNNNQESQEELDFEEIQLKYKEFLKVVFRGIKKNNNNSQQQQNNNNNGDQNQQQQDNNNNGQQQQQVEKQQQQEEVEFKNRLRNWEEFKDMWTVLEGEKFFDQKYLFREICFIFFKEQLVKYTKKVFQGRQDAKMAISKYRHVFLKAVIDPVNFNGVKQYKNLFIYDDTEI